MNKNPDKKKNQFVMTLQRTVENKVSLIGLIILGVLLLLIIFADVIAPYDPNYMDVTAIHGTPSARHILGCDQFGRDLFSRILYGGRYSLALGFICAIIGFAAGVIFGSPVGGDPDLLRPRHRLFLHDPRHDDRRHSKLDPRHPRHGAQGARDGVS